MDDLASVMPQNDELHAGSPRQSVHSGSILFFRVVIWRLDILYDTCLASEIEYSSLNAHRGEAPSLTSLTG